MSNGNEPELRVDGIPFFVHAATFDYFRIPPDLWFPSLDRYSEMGINTIDLRIPWNWHEPSDGQFDFDGHTNPRRDLRTLLKIITEKRMKLIVRPGPLIGDEWRNDGYPPWLLAYSNYRMRQADIQKGIAPADALLAKQDANAAARDWLANDLHMSYARRWMTAIATELAPYAAKNNIVINVPGDREGESQEMNVSGPLLFVSLDDRAALSPETESPELKHYLSELRGALLRGGLDAVTLIDAADVSKQGAASISIPSPEGEQASVHVSGNWFFPPSVAGNVEKTVSAGPAPLRDAFLSNANAFSLSFLASSLGTQNNFPPFLSEFAATRFAPAGELRAIQPAAENTLLASRLLLGNGIRGIVYSPLQDSLTPVGWETTTASRYFRWDAALDLAGNREPPATGVARNGQFISVWGAMLASSHPRADFGIVDLRTCMTGGTAHAISQNATSMQTLFRLAVLAGFAPELVNPAAQSVERLLRDPVILLSVPEPSAENVQLSEIAQTVLVEYVRRGGVLVYFPARPPGNSLEDLWRGRPEASPANAAVEEWAFERGRVVASSNGFGSLKMSDADIEDGPTHREASPTVDALNSLLTKAGAVRGLMAGASGKKNANVFTTELISNEMSALAGHPQVCAEGQMCAAALISVTNIGSDPILNEPFEVSDPSSASSKPAARNIPFELSMPAHESLLLPVHAPLCSAAPTDEHCSDEVTIAGAELLGAEREGKTLELTFYAPARAVIRLHLESEPSKVELDDDIRLDEQWKQETGEMEVILPRGAAPDYRRVLRVHLRYTPQVVESSDNKNHRAQGSDYEVFDAIHFPVAGDASIPTLPSLIAANPVSGGSFVISSRNRSDDARISNFDLEGAFHATGSARMYGNEVVFTRMRFQPTRNPAPSAPAAAPTPDGLLHGDLAVHSGRSHGTGPVLFVPLSDDGSAHYQFDFERDGSLDWVLETGRLRLIVSPAEGGRALALVDKTTGDNLITLSGALHDFVVPAGAALPEALAPGDFSFNRAYQAQWSGEKKDLALRLTYQQYENSVAGLHVEKTLRMTASETVEAAYRVWITMPALPGNSIRPESKQSFISQVTVPVPVVEEGKTQFCWENSSAQHCEDFVSSGTPISVPDGTMRMKILSPGRNTIDVEWTSGAAVIVPKAYSADVNVVVPIASSTELPGEFKLRYTVESGK